MRLTSPSRRVFGFLAAGTIGLSTTLLSLTGVAHAATGGPNAPTIEAAEGGDTTATVFFTANWADDAGVTPDADYFEYSLDGGSNYTEADVTPGMNGFDGGFDIAGLVNGTEYSVTLRGVSEGADPADPADDIPGDASSAKKVTPYKGATAPGNPTITVGPAQVTVSWTAATAGTFPIAGYTVGSYVQAGEGGGNAQLCQTNATTLTCTASVVPGYKYAIYVFAVDSKGNGGADTDVAPQTVAIPAAAAPATVPAKNGDLTLPAGAKSTVAPGKTITVNGSGYAPNSTITLAIYSTPQVLTTVVTDASGNFTATVTVPADLAAGDHTLVASGVDPSGNVRYVNLAVTVSSSGKAQLAYTGADVALPSIVGLLAVSVGTGLIVVRRRAARSAA